MIEKFGREEFEQALTDIGASWRFAGFSSGEICYAVQPCNEFARIFVRSSIRGDGKAADSGDDSIRMWIEVMADDGGWLPVKKLDAYTTRVPGWQRRVGEKIAELGEYACRVVRAVPTCKQCGKVEGVWFTAQGKNEGRPAAKCFKCDSGFVWLDVALPPVVQQGPRAEEADDFFRELDAALAAQDTPPTGVLVEQGSGVVFAPNLQQQAAIDVELGRCARVIAGPGSGKTKVLVGRYGHLLDRNVDPGAILMVTFNKTMADEMLGKVVKAYPEVMGTAGESQICTIHALCYRLLREAGDRRDVPKEWQLKKLIKEIAEKHWQSHNRPGWEEIFTAISNAKARGLAAYNDSSFYTQWFGGEHGMALTKARDDIDRAMKREGWITFSDMLYEIESLILREADIVNVWKHRFAYVLVDEGQDTNGQSMRILSALAERGRMYIVGDPDQLLYRFTGATPEANLYEGFDERYPDGAMLMLETNYRSTHNIVATCNALIAHNYADLGGPYEERFRKRLVARDDAPMGAVPDFREYDDPEGEAAWLVQGILAEMSEGYKPGAFFVGARTRAQLGYLEGPLMMAGVPFVNITGGSFWQMKHIQDVLGYLRLAHDPFDREAFCRVYNIASKAMVHPWGKDEGEYCNHRYLGRQFLQACEEKYGNVHYAVRQRRSWEYGVQDLVELVQGVQSVLRKEGPAAAIQFVVDECYRDWMKAEDGLISGDEAENGKLSDLETFADIARSQPDTEALLGFIEKAIKAAEDARKRNWDEYVVLSTIHRLKGLERPIVYGVGWCEGEENFKDGTKLPGGLLPHTFSLREPPQNGVLNIGGMGRIEDERCMAFVLISRAKERCHLSGIRKYRSMECKPSRFLEEAGILIKEG